MMCAAAAGESDAGPLGHVFKQANNERENRNNKKTSRAIRHTAATHTLHATPW